MSCLWFTVAACVLALHILNTYAQGIVFHFHFKLQGSACFLNTATCRIARMNGTSVIRGIDIGYTCLEESF
ncbi:hypothetical protein EDD18DRAFT_1128956 [Armillaria luteobubalina]|uniref:Secreted protein n=1 Tax=Armillaria luteobubalina TaxID=153913 RepID=A0AA39V4K0_9AGAR|nr:hypothetical protein EDD18DRAFT_1128956 [Armillaria luteobubalina]